MQQRRSCGLLGGTFNPVHNGHLGIARAAMQSFALEEVWFIPCAIPPHKSIAAASNADRLAMLELATQDEPAFHILTLEFERDGPSYTVDTLHTLRARFPETDFTFIIGADSLRQLHTWHEPLEILRLARVVTLARPGTPPPTAEELQLPPPLAETLLADFREGEPLDVSSSEIRNMCAEDIPIPEELVPPAVIRYIAERKLYR